MTTNKTIHVSDSWQSDYQYDLVRPEGGCFDSGFLPQLTPKQMLELGVFGGSYFYDTPHEFPADWFNSARLSPTSKPDPLLNFFEITASQPLLIWQQKGWIYKDDPRGWFQWYCRYYMGRRIENEDKRQIKRWKAIKRHVAQVKKSCTSKDLSCRRKQRQALLHWAYDSRQI